MQITCIISEMNLIFFGSDPWFSPPVLQALLQAGHKVVMAVTKGDVLDVFSGLQVKRLTDMKTAATFTPANLLELDNLSEPADVIVLAAFGPPFLSNELLAWPKYGALNVHASLLPRWRGASPVAAAIAAGDRQTGVSIMRMTETIDRGPVLSQASVAIQSEDNRETLTKKLGELGGNTLAATLNNLVSGHITETPQPADSPTPYTRRLTKDSGRINWSRSPAEIERFIRSVTPWPGAWAESKEEGRRKKAEGIPIKILKAHLEFPLPSSLYPLPYLVIDEIQLPGKNPISWKQFTAGHPHVTLDGNDSSLLTLQS